MTPVHVLFTLIAALAGLAVGAIINALADDLPYTYRPGLPRYPDGTPRPPVAWSGLLAFALGKRRAPALPAGADHPAPASEADATEAPEISDVPAAPAVRLSWRHPLTEVATALLFALVAADSGPSVRAAFLMGNVAWLILITVIDLEHRMILFAVIIPACVYALAGAALLGPALFPRVEFRDYLIGAALGFGIFGVMYLGGMLFSVVAAQARGEPLEEVAFGYGDVLLATLSGLMLGWQALIFAITIAVFAGGAGALFFLAFRLVARGRYELFTALPYGQYIVFGTLVMLLWRTPVVQFLQRTG